MDLNQITPTIWQLPLPVGHVHLVRRERGYAAIDTGVPGTTPAILDALRQLGARPSDLRQIVLTHSHADHMGSAADLAAATGAEVLAGAIDTPVISGTEPEPEARFTPAELELHLKVTAGWDTAPPLRHLPVDRQLADGDALEGWGEPIRIHHVPGHTAGAVALYLPDSGVLFPGDIIGGGPAGLRLGPFNLDRAQAIASFHRLAALTPRIICPPHGTPVTSGAADLLRAATPETDWL
jgi:glyoxylase-like metal-dependent hydrolase (beta-lactamase superfamily II)